MTKDLPKSTPTRRSVFARRLVSTLALWSVVLAGLFSGNAALASGLVVALLTLLALAGLIEFRQLAHRAGLPCFPLLTAAGGSAVALGSLLATAGWLPPAVPWNTALLSIVLTALFLRQLAEPAGSNGLAAVGVSFLGIAWVGWWITFLGGVYFLPDRHGAWFLLFTILVTKFSDMGAYLVGSAIGRHKMIPRLSPGKTWEGFGGALLVATGAGVALVALAGERLEPLRWAHAVVLGLLLALGAVVGDLVESMIKRQAGAKDSGAMLPGIGGALDLLDSLLFNAPIAYLYLAALLSDATP